MMKSRAGFLGVFALVLAAGIWLGRISVEQTSSPVILAESPTTQTISKSLSVEPKDRPATKASTPFGHDPVVELTNEDVLFIARSLSRFERLKLRSEMNTSTDLNFQFRLFKRGSESLAEFTDAFQADFHLSDREVGNLQELFANVNDEHEQMEFANAVGSWSEDGSGWVFEIRPFPEQGGVLYDRLLVGIEAAIGPEKMSVFHETYGLDFEKKFGEIGTRERSLVFAMDSTSSGRKGSIKISDLIRMINSARQSSSLLSESEVRERYGPLIEKLPPEFFSQNPGG